MPKSDTHAAENYQLPDLQIFEQPASQAVKPMPPVSESIRNAHDASPVVLNLQITNVPEVSVGVNPQQWLNQIDAVFEAGAQAVRPIEQWVATPNAVSDAFATIGSAIKNAFNYYGNTPADQVWRDTQSVLKQAGDALDQTFSYPHTAKTRAKTAGWIMPLFFFDGNIKEPIHPETVQQLGLDGLKESELSQLGISRFVHDAQDLYMPEVPEHLRHLELQKATPELLDAMVRKGRTIITATEGSDDLERLKATGASGSFILTDTGEMIMTLPEQPSKITALEEFLHGTQAKLGTASRITAEIEVKNFMVHHAKMLGLSENECIVLQAMKDQELQRLSKKGFTWLGE